MIFVDITVTAVAGPAISNDFHIDANGANWIANAYLIALAALMAIGGRVGDMMGTRSLTTFNSCWWVVSCKELAPRLCNPRPRQSSSTALPQVSAARRWGFTSEFP